MKKREHSYKVPTNFDKLEAKQQLCPHDHFSIRCSICLKVLGSEVIITDEETRKKLIKLLKITPIDLN